jgi:hypothetical protein
LGMARSPLRRLVRPATAEGPVDDNANGENFSHLR